MIASSDVPRVDYRDHLDPKPYLASHRALAACAREFARLSEVVVEGVAALVAGGVEEKAVVRQSPGRCIVQLGPVALTVAWLRSTLDSVEAGELLVILWRGAVAPRTKLRPERTLEGPAPIAATALHEQVFLAVAESEESWTWQPADGAGPRRSSTELADSWVERLRQAYDESPRPERSTT